MTRKYSEKEYRVIRGLRDAHNHGDFDNISSNKARKILHDKKLFGKPLTPEQYKLFGYLSKGNTLKYEQGGEMGGKPCFDNKRNIIPCPPVFKSQSDINVANNFAKSFSKRKGYNIANYAYVARNIGDPIPQFINPNNSPINPLPNRYNIPPEVQKQDIFTSEGNAFYNDPHTGYLEQVDISVLNKPRFKNQLKKGGNPYKAEGGYNDLYNFLFDDEEEDNKKASPPTAPTTEDVETDATPEDSGTEDDLAMQIATEDFTSRRDRNPYSSHDAFSLNTQRKTGNPYTLNPYLKETNEDIFGNYNVSNLGALGDSRHQSIQSDHNPNQRGVVNAQDYGVSDPNMGAQIVGKLQTEAGDRNVKYIIYNGRIWNPSVSPEWRKYSGKDPHTTHIHVSYNE